MAHKYRVMQTVTQLHLDLGNCPFPLRKWPHFLVAKEPQFTPFKSSTRPPKGDFYTFGQKQQKS